MKNPILIIVPQEVPVIEPTKDLPLEYWHNLFLLSVLQNHVAGMYRYDSESGECTHFAFDEPVHQMIAEMIYVLDHDKLNMLEVGALRKHLQLIEEESGSLNPGMNPIVFPLYDLQKRSRFVLEVSVRVDGPHDHPFRITYRLQQ